MRILQLAWLLPALSGLVAANTPSTDGIKAFVKRRLPDHADSFEFSISNVTAVGSNDNFSVSSHSDGKIKIQGTSVSAVMQG